MTTEGITRRSALLAALGAGVAAPAVHADGRRSRALGHPARRAARPTHAVMQAVTRVAGGRRLVAAGERGLVIFSDDDGRSWTQARVPVGATLTALRFIDTRRGWAVGNLGVVLQTEDGGESWALRLDGQGAAGVALQAAQAQFQAVRRGSEAAARASALVEDAQRLVAEGADKPLLYLAVRPDGSLLVVGAYALAFASRDGLQWDSLMHRLPNPDALSYYGVAQRRGETLLFGEQGLLLRADAAGAAFTAQPSPTQGSLFGAVPLREGPVLLLGLRGKAWRSAAPGDAWRAVQTPVDASLIAGMQLADGAVLLAGAAGQLLQSRDGGEQFRPLALAQRFPFTGLAQAADGALLLAGMRGLLRLAPDDLKAAEAGQAHPPAFPVSRKPTA